MWGITRPIVFLALMGAFFIPLRADALSFTPTVSDLFFLPGASDEVTIQIFSNAGDTQTYLVDVLQAELEDSETFTFSELSDEVQSWVEISEQEFVLTPGEVKNLTFRVSVPEDAPEGWHAFGVRVLESVPQNGSVSTQTGVMSLVFLTVGDLPASALIEHFQVSSFRAHLPVYFSTSIRNTGAAILQPEGSVRVTNLFGATVASIPFNPRNSRVLPGSTREFQVEWGERRESKHFFDALQVELEQFTFGWFRAELQVEVAGTSHTDVQTFWVIPWRFLLILTVFTAFLLLMMRGNRKYHG